MSSPSLGSIPCDILQHIAFLCSLTTVFAPPVDVLHLLLTSRTFYRSLNFRDAPYLYADIFCTKFDAQVSVRRYGTRWTDSALAAELMRRCRLLRRAQRLDFSPAGLVQDLWAALWMLLESDRLNRKQLNRARFPEFILGLAHRELSASSVSSSMKHIIVCLLSLTLRRQTILGMSKKDRDELYGLVFPFIFSPQQPSKPPQGSLICAHCSHRDHVYGSEGPTQDNTQPRCQCIHDHPIVSAYQKTQFAMTPNSATAAINLASAILESTPMRIPYHLPETRAIAIATQRSGPTQEEYKALVAYETLLQADFAEEQHEQHEQQQQDDDYSSSSTLSEPCPDHPYAMSDTPPGFSRHNDLAYAEILRSLDPGHGSSNVFSYTPGTMTGLWEGIFRTAPSPKNYLIASTSSTPSPSPALGFTKPFQCCLVEYICSGHTGSLSAESEGDILEHPLCFPNLLDPKSSFELQIAGRKYRRYSPGDEVRRCHLPSHNDILMLGQTLEGHAEAWGGYKFFGKVQTDGHLFLKREAKDTASPNGKQIFEGHLPLLTMVVGRWRFVSENILPGQGIFSLVKSRNGWKV
ncbi:hypothetical protein D9613_003906 [Agrocybe pediades]|uniref:F-box domain-containing protein n=1 Tax=Agrocybe pediades TaxID=84607 RepID=A0A8H4VIX9_9AGAR|nr:hypothetical protein D9613_003906 [Agrocybe pediades]